MAESKIPVPFSIKYINLSGTTDDVGRLFTKFDIENKVILAVLSGSNGQIALQVRLSTDKLCVKYFRSDTMALVSKENVSLDVFYADI